jgi:multicomponent K+:H+ antiporter subunit E
MRALSRLVPHPLVSLAVGVSWLLLVNTLTLNAVVFATILGLLVPQLTRAYWPEAPSLRNPLRIVEYVLLVLWDICIANLQVARVILFVPNAALRPAWITVPLELRAPEAITLLAGTITMTPGTVSADLSACGRALLVHCLHAPDPDEVRDQIKSRYEARLKEIFA